MLQVCYWFEVTDGPSAFSCLRIPHCSRVCVLVLFVPAYLHFRARVRRRASVSRFLWGFPLVLRTISFASGSSGGEREGALGAPRSGGARVTTGYKSCVISRLPRGAWLSHLLHFLRVQTCELTHRTTCREALVFNDMPRHMTQHHLTNVSGLCHVLRGRSLSTSVLASSRANSVA